MSSTSGIVRCSVDLGRLGAATLWRSGAGSPLVLLHGGWGGAEAHWSSVWDSLARSYDVIAPELPGFSGVSAPVPKTYAEFATWVATLIAELRTGPVVLVGNSFGASVAWCIAVSRPELCRGLVIVDGIPPPKVAAPMRWLLRRGPLKIMGIGHMRKHAYGPRALATAFHDPARAPEAIRGTLARAPRETIEAMLDVVVGSPAVHGTPSQPTLVLWGESDRLPNSDPDVGRSLAKKMPDARFVEISEAGHLPQVEQPERFLAVLEPFLRDVGNRTLPGGAGSGSLRDEAGPARSYAASGPASA